MPAPHKFTDVAPIALFPGIIDRLGDDGFGQSLIEFLNLVVGAEHCTVFRLEGVTPANVVTVSHDGSDTALRQSSLYLSRNYWRSDALLSEARKQDRIDVPAVSRIGVADMSDMRFRSDIYEATHVGERILLYGGRPGARLGVSILRPEHEGQASQTQIGNLSAVSETLISLLHKHVRLLDSRAELSLALTSIDHIVATIDRARVSLPRRETEVCARTILGVQTAGIAAELGIGEETVMTYRKRAYQRLGIATQRELLLWYVAEWGLSHPQG